jgi:hypothetical protein
VLEHLPQVPANALPQPQADLPGGLLEGQPVQEVLDVRAAQGIRYLPAVGPGTQPACRSQVMNNPNCPTPSCQWRPVRVHHCKNSAMPPAYAFVVDSD